jgi:NADH-quinone oxidoreductase subunit K
MIGGIPLYWYLLLSFGIFSVGLLGVLLRRNALVMLMSIELMLNAANLVFVAYARFRGDETGHVISFFVMALAAAEAAVGLALVIAIYRHFKTLAVDRLRSLGG